MAAEWYYTTNKIQMGPVSWTELRELADVGILKPHDMVWSDGMSEWAKAINQDGLFADGGADSSSSRKKSAFTEPSKPPPARRTRRREEEDDEDEEDEDDRKKKRRNRERDEKRAKTGIGIKVGLIIGGVCLVLMLLVCAGGGLIWLSTGAPAKGPGPVVVPIAGGGGGAVPVPVPVQPGARPVDTFVVRALVPKRWEEKRYTFQQGKKMVITVTTNFIGGRAPDVDLFIHRGNGPGDFLAAQDVSIGPNSRLEFFVPANDTYRVRVGNHGPGIANSCTVTIVEQP